MSTLALLPQAADTAAVLVQSTTKIHLFGIATVLALGVAILIVPRRYAVVPMLVMACTIAPGQKVVIASLDFNLLRILVIVGWMRIFMRREVADFRVSKADVLLVLWSLAGVVSYTALFGTLGALVNRLGRSYDFIGLYFFMRCVLRGWRDVDTAVVAVVWLSFPVLLAFLVEKSMGRNLFSFLGGVREITVVREGRLRCQGPFQHAILAGLFWASLLPMVVARLWRPRGSKMVVVAAAAAMLQIVVLTSSSTPLGAVAACVVGGAAYVLRREMMTIVWLVLVALVLLHFVMEAPVWHLISRIDLVGGSTGYHRYLLIDQAIKRIDEWWLFGVRSTRHWGYGMQDVANQYVFEAVTGGLLTLSMFLGLLVASFANAGRMWRAAPTRYTRVLAWSFGVSLFAQCMAFMAVGVTFSSQNLLVLIFVIAAMTSLSDPRILRAKRMAAARKRALRAA